MLIGEDFEKIQFTLFGLDLLEPNGLIGNLILCLLTLYIAFRLKKSRIEHPFVTNWYYYFLGFGIAFIFGGLGHTLWNYWGLYGKIIPWFSALFTVFFMEQAMISLHKSPGTLRLLKNLSVIKLVLFNGLLLFVLLTNWEAIELDLPKGFIVPSVGSALGILFSMGGLSWFYHRKKYGDFRYFLWSVAVLLPSAIFQVMKINIHPWMDRNDVAHLFMLFSYICYYQGVKEISRSKTLDPN